MTPSRQELEAALRVLQAHQQVLGPEVVDTIHRALAGAAPADADRGPAAPPAERKQVTVLFADIAGFTALSETLDPEDVRSLINACFDRLVEVIHRYGGYIDKFIGDEVMALFGAPVALENAAERALLAALDMKKALAEFNAHHADRLPRPLSLHFGLNTGPVIAGSIGARYRQDYSVLGDAVNLAARLEDLSGPNEILVGENTYRLTETRFEFEALPPVTVKGKSRPVRVYRLVRARPSPGTGRGLRGVVSPLVGRGEQMARLHDALADLLAGQGQVVAVTGEAGIGKSRLVQELQALCRREWPELQLRWAAGRAVSYGENISYLVTRHLLVDLLAPGRDASPADTAAVLEKELRRLAPDRAAVWYPFLAHLLELPLPEETTLKLARLGGEALHRQTLQTVYGYLDRLAQADSLVLVGEDLHWADPSSLELLETIFPLTARRPILLILVYRLRRESRIWAFHQRLPELTERRFLHLDLPPLSRADSGQLLDNLLNRSPLPDRVRQLILDKTEGNPFFIEEVIRSLIERQVLVRTDGDIWRLTATSLDDIQIPDTLQGVIMARIDRLPPEEKRVLQVASVMGRTFQYSVLARVLAAELGLEDESGE